MMRDVTDMHISPSVSIITEDAAALKGCASVVMG